MSTEQTAVIYTAIFGGYDELCEPRRPVPNVQYICFTDNPYLKSKVWEIRYQKPQGDPLFQAKRIKFFAHEMVQCDVSLWIDGRITLQSLNGAFHQPRADVALRRHPLRNCIYDEAAHCKRVGRGDPSRIDAAIRRYRAEGYPPAVGLWFTGVILRRHSPATKAFNVAWWKEMIRGSSRDQISFPVVLRRLGTSFASLPSGTPDYRMRYHLQRYWR